MKYERFIFPPCEGITFGIIQERDEEVRLMNPESKDFLSFEERSKITVAAWLYWMGYLKPRMRKKHNEKVLDNAQDQGEEVLFCE